MKKIKDIADLIIGDSPPELRTGKWDGNDILFATISDVKDCKYLSTTNLSLNKSATKYLKIIPANTLLVSIAGTIGKPVILTKDMAISQSFIALTNLNNVYLEYLYNLFNTFYQNNILLRYSTKTFQPNLSLTTFKEIELKIPSLSEQENSLKAIDYLNKLIFIYEKSLNQQQTMKAKLLFNVFEQNFITNKNSSVKIKKFKDISKINIGRTPLNPQVFYTKNNTPITYMGIKKLSNSKYIFHSNEYVNPEEIKQSMFVEKDSVLMTIYSNIGRVFINKTDLCISQAFVAFQENKIQNEYLFYYLQYLKLNKTLEKHSYGTVSINLSKKNLANLEIKIFDKNIREKIINYFSKLDEYIGVKQNQLDIIRKYLSSTSAELFL